MVLVPALKVAHKLVLLLLAMIAIVWMVGLYAANISEKALQASIERDAISEAQTMIESIDHLLATEVRQWEAFSHGEEIRRAADASNQHFESLIDPQGYIDHCDQLWRKHTADELTDAVIETEAHPLSAELRHLLDDMASEFDYPPVVELFVTNRYGANVAQSQITTDYRQSDEAWWQNAMREGRHLGDVEFDESAGMFAVDVCVRIDDVNDQPLGVMKVVLNVDQVMEIIHEKASVQSAVDRHWTVLNRDGVVLASTNSALHETATHPLFQAAQIDHHQQQWFEYGLPPDGRSVLCAIVSAQGKGCLQDLGWLVLTEQNKSIALAPAERLRAKVLTVATCASLAALCLGVGLAVSIASRTSKLLVGVREFTAGNLTYRIHLEGGDENAVIAGGLNEMACTLNNAHDRVLEQTEKLEQQNAALSAEVLERQRTEDELLTLTASLKETNAEMDQLLAKAAHQSAELTFAKAEAEAASRTKSEFLSNMSHELRTPLTAILGFSENLLADGDIDKAPPERVDALRTILRNGEHLLQLINDILDLSKIEAGRMDVERIKCSPLEVASHAVDSMQFRAKANNLQLNLHCDTSIPATMHSDPTRLKQILINLIGNAVKFTEMGSVDVHVAYREKDGEGFVDFEVRDSGIGMTDQQIQRLFRPFAQADSSTTRKFGGTGLGLTITKQLVEMLGGEISVMSEPGRGSTFRFSIPTGDVSHVKRITLADVQGCAKRELKQGSGDLPKLDCRVLIAEDGPDNQRLLRFVLENACAEVELVENVQLAYDAVMAAKTQGTPFDVILMDMQMPVLDGYCATRKLREEGYELPILAATAHAMSGEREKCISAGCDDYTTKPIDRADLLHKVAALATRELQTAN